MASAQSSTQARSGKNRPILMAGFVLALVSLSYAGWRYFSTSAPAASQAPEFCDMNMSKGKSMGAAHEESLSSNAGDPPVIDLSPAPGPAADGMVWIPAGEFSMGTQEAMFTDTRPVHRVAVN